MTRKTKAPGMKRAKLPNPLVRRSWPGPKKARDEVRKFHGKEPVDPMVRENVKILKNNPTKKNVLDIASDLGHDIAGFRAAAAETLGLAAKKGVDITPAFPALVKALSDSDQDVRFQAVLAFAEASTHHPASNFEDLDISKAIPGLINLLSDPNPGIHETAASCLVMERYTTLVIKTIKEYMSSEWFQNEMAKNSPVYVRTANSIANLLSTIKEFVI